LSKKADEVVNEYLEDGFRVTIKVDDLREMIHALHYVNTDKDYILRFPIHVVKQCEIIDRMDELLDRVEKAMNTKKVEMEKTKKYHVNYSEYKVEIDKSGVKPKGEDIHNGGG